MIYDIHQCAAHEKEAVVEFIRKYWSESHIFTYCDELLDFQHRNVKGGYNFIVGLNTQTGEIDGIVGYIPLAQFDSELAKYGDQWGAIWKVRDDIQNDEIGLLGLLLYERITELVNSHSSIGISDIARKIFKIQRQTLASLSQYYIVNEACHNFKIAKFESHPVGHEAYPDVDIALRPITITQAALVKCAYAPQKSVKYLENRYIKHPIYRYELLGVFNRHKLCSVLVVRKIETQGARCLRIVDVYGSVEATPNIYCAVQTYLKQIDAEYIDCLNYGISAKEFERIGFSVLDLTQDKIIIPNYFEPFFQKNIQIDCAYKAPKDYPYVVFKGDADQDRPNMI